MIDINFYIKQLQKYDELYTKFFAISNMTVETAIELFMKGYTMEQPEYLSFEELGKLATGGEK